MIVKAVHFAIFASLCLSVSGWLAVDRSLENACEDMKGEFTAREPQNDQAAVGDTCKMTWKNVYTADEAEAREFCELYAPWRLNSVEWGDNTVCNVEATLMCKPGWMQMFGHCYQMPRKMQRFTRAKAKIVCGSTSQIATLRHKYIVGVWSRIFRNVEQIWVDASPAWEKYVIRIEDPHAKGEGLALAFNGDNYDFRVMGNSLVRVKEDLELQVLCEYKPPMTRAEINYINRRYQEIYYPGVPVDDGVLVRTSSHYPSGTSNADVCKKVLAPFMSHRDIGRFIPFDPKLQSLTEFNPKGISYSLAHAHSKIAASTRNKVSCQALSNKYGIHLDYSKFLTLLNASSTVCDNMGSTMVTHVKGKATMEVTPDSRMAPMWCKLGTKKTYSFKAPLGFREENMFQRSTGVVFAHRLFWPRRNYTDAEKYCQDYMYGAHLSGFDSWEEAEFMRKMLREYSYTTPAWIGLRRRSECINVASTSVKSLDDKCSKINVMQWQNGVAHNRLNASMWGKAVYGGNTSDVAGAWDNPDYKQLAQECVTIFDGTQSWALESNPGILDDIQCDSEFYFFCGAPATSIEERSWY